VILRGIKQTALVALLGTVLSGCLAELPGGETGPFAPGNTLTFYYQSVLTDPPEQAVIIDCGDQFVARSCVRLWVAVRHRPIQQRDNGRCDGSALGIASDLGLTQEKAPRHFRRLSETVP